MKNSPKLGLDSANMLDAIDSSGLMVERFATVLAVVVFISSYIYGLFNFGVLLTVLLGWLPAGIIAWCCAHALCDITALARRVVG